MKKIYQLAIAALAALTLTACSGNAGDGSNASGQEEADAPAKSYSLKYDINSNSGDNWEAFTAKGDQIETPIQVEENGNDVTITMPFRVIVTGKPLPKGNLKAGKATFYVENSSEKGKVEFSLTDDKDWDAEAKKLGEGDTIEFTIKGTTTKDMLEKINGNWGSFTLQL